MGWFAWAFGVLGLNVGLTAVGGLVGAVVACSGSCRNDESGGLTQLLGLVLGGGVGLLSANIIDVAALSYETVEPADKRNAPRRQSSHFTLAPQVAVSPDKAHFGLGGTF